MPFSHQMPAQHPVSLSTEVSDKLREALQGFKAEIAHEME